MQRKVSRILVLGACLCVLGACQDDQEKAAEHLSRGSAYQKQGDYPSAIIEYKNVLQLDPNNAAAHWGLAKGYLANQQIPEGFWELRETVRLDVGAGEWFGFRFDSLMASIAASANNSTPVLS